MASEADLTSVRSAMIDGRKNISGSRIRTIRKMYARVRPRLKPCFYNFPGFQDFDRDYAGFHIACGKYIIRQLVRCLCIQFRNVCMFCVVQRRIIRMKYKGGVFIQTNRLPSYFSAVSQVVLPFTSRRLIVLWLQFMASAISSILISLK